MRNAIPMMLALRAYGVPARKQAQQPSPSPVSPHGRRKAFPKPSKFSVIFDVETTTDHAQAPRFGVYQVRDGHTLKVHGIFFDPDVLTRTEQKLLRSFTTQHGLTLITKEEFVRTI